MARYSVSCRTTATAATADHCYANMWNPHASISIFVREVSAFKTIATVDNPGLVRTSTIGTPAAVVTPDIDNHYNRRYAPISLATLQQGAFSVQPTVQGPYIMRSNLPAAIGSGLVWVFSEPFELPAGTGLALATPVAVIGQVMDLTYVWDE